MYTQSRSHPNASPGGGTMKDWGQGILQTGREYHIIQAFDEQLGLREFRAKINSKVDITDGHPNRLSINAEFNYGSTSIETVKRYLESGVLSRLLASDFPSNCRWTNQDILRHTTLAACCMSLGCKLPPELKENLDKTYQKAVHMPSLAKLQLQKAITTYEEGTPYDYGNATMLEVVQGRKLPGITKLKVTGYSTNKILETRMPNGKLCTSIVGPPTDDELGLKPVYGNHVCAMCGADHHQSGGELSLCSHCNDRKYCSKQCQRKHWKLHKVICTIPAEEMKDLMDSIPAVQKCDTGDVFTDIYGA